MSMDWLGLPADTFIARHKEIAMDRPSNPASRLAAAMIIAASSAALSTPSSAESAPDLDQLTAREAAADLCAGKITSKALVSAALARAKAKDNLNAFITLDEAGALKEAAAFDASHRKGKSCKPLGGVPVVVKDNIEVAGLPSSAGTPALKGYVPKQDAPVVEKLRAAGAIIIGKTNMHELAFGISGYNGAFKTGTEPGVRNAYDASKIAGGSSSGTASAIGARIVTAGLGTDTGGSVRIPCALNGCSSLRPTVGRYPQGGIAPISHTRDTAGSMASTVADVAILDRAIAGGGAIAPAALKEVRIGIVASMLANLDGDTDKAFHAAIDKLKAAGVTVVEVDMPKLAELNGQVGFPVALYEAYDDMVAYLKHTGTGITIEELAKSIASPDVKGTYDGLVIPQAARTGQHRGRRQAGLRCRNQDSAAGAAGALPRHLCEEQAGCDRLSDHAQGRDISRSQFEQPGEFRAVHPEHRSRQQCRRARRPASGWARRHHQIAGRIGARWARRQRPPPDRDRDGDGEAVRTASRACNELDQR